MPQNRIEQVRRALIESGLATVDEIVGCSETEIAKLEREWGCNLPTAYRRFLQVMGKNAGQFLVGTDAFYASLEPLQQGAAEILQESGMPFELPPEAVVFAMHQGYQFWFFSTSEGDDPPVYYYLEQRSAWSKVADHFSEFLMQLAGSQADFAAMRERYRAEHGLPRRRDTPNQNTP